MATWNSQVPQPLLLVVSSDFLWLTIKSVWEPDYNLVDSSSLFNGRLMLLMVWKLNIEDQTVHLKRERKWWWWRQQEVDKLNRSTSALAVIGLHCNSASWPEMHFLKCTQSVHCSAASFKCTGLYFVMQSTFLQVETVTYSTTLNIVKRSPLTRVEKLSFLTKIRTGLMSNYVPKVSEVLRSHLKIIFTFSHFHIFTFSHLSHLVDGSSS